MMLSQVSGRAFSTVPHVARMRPDPEFNYELLKSGPEVPSTELENASRWALELFISWGGNVLHVAHLSRPKPFVIGEPEPHLKTSVDFVMPAEWLGTTRLELVTWREGQPILSVPHGAGGGFDSQKHGRLTWNEAPQFGGSCSAPGLVGSLPLDSGVRARLWLGRFEVDVALVPCGRKLAHQLVESDTLIFAQTAALTALTFGGLLAALAYFVPPLGVTDEEAHDKKRLVLVQQYLAALAEKEKEPALDEASAIAPSPSGGSGERHQGESGAMGTSLSSAKNKRYQVEGPRENSDPHLARRSVRELVSNFGMLGLLNSPVANAKAPTSPFGRDAALGLDPTSALGNMWGPEPGEVFGIGGLDVSGSGESGGGPGQGVGMGPLGTLGHGDGPLAGNDFGLGRFGTSHGRPNLDGHPPKVPRLRVGPTSVSGRLPAEVIQRIVRQNFGRFRLCYEGGLRKNPNLEGRVSVRFAIDREGTVASAQLGGSDLPDSQVASCVVAAFYGLGFPKPEGGLVSVSYPILFAPQ
jgi:hypothetical protein